METIRLTMAQALIKFLDQQYIEIDSKTNKFVAGVYGIFGHGNVTGIGEALENVKSDLIFRQGHNEQGMVHTAIAYAKQKNRREIYACTASIGPGSLNMITAAATATVNRIPVLLLPGDIFACRQPDPVLQQIECEYDHGVSANDCFKPVSVYWDRIERPEQLLTALNNAFRILTDPSKTGAVTICLPQDVQAEAYDYPIHYFKKRIHYIDRMPLSSRALDTALKIYQGAKRPLIIAGGGVHYAEATDTLNEFATLFKIPVAETQAGKSVMHYEHPMSVGGIGVTGTEAANKLAQDADVILAIGTRLSDFTTASKTNFNNGTRLLHLNISDFDASKMDAVKLIADAKLGLQSLIKALQEIHFQTSQNYQTEIKHLREAWALEVDRLYGNESRDGNSQTRILGILNDALGKDDVIVCAAGSLPGDLHRLWRSKGPKTYHLEYGFSCMGYEIAGGVGVKLADKEKEVYVLLGDGSFVMLHSELITSMQEGLKINVILFNNSGYQCIKGLQMQHGSKGFGNEFKKRSSETQQLDGEVIPINFTQYAEGLGVKAFYAENIQAFQKCLALAKKETRSTLIEIPVLANSMSPAYNTWWRVGVAEVSDDKAVRQAHEKMLSQIKLAKVY